MDGSGFGFWWLRAALSASALSTSLLCGGCFELMAGDSAQAAFATDFKCERSTVQEQGALGRYRITGCGHEATYQCLNGYQCVIQTDRTEPVQEASSRRPEPVRPPEPAEVEVESKTDASLMVMELLLDKKAKLRITATPNKQADLVQLKLLRRTKSEDVDECSLDFMINNQVLAMPKGAASQDGEVLAHRVQIGHDLISEFSTAEKISVRACSEHWSLSREQVQKVRDFMDRYQEELAWNGPVRASTGGMLAPTGGWPAWRSEAAKLPAGVEGAALDPRTLFKKLSASVFQLEGTRSEGRAQGSAVAISTTELVTNCHVVQGALKLVLKQQKHEWPARVVRADPATDRCIITTDALMLQPVAGVRAYDSVEVGEPVYTLGSPVGLELTLSDGIISGRRDEEKRRYLQTTAPISPGSSGGGLFDARGNLIGVTTLVLAGRERLNQSLNFAIPAESFFAP